MAMFRKRRDEGEYDEEYEVETPRRKIRDLRPEFKKKRKEPPKPWGKKERYIVLAVLLVTLVTAAALGLGARDFKLPGFPKLEIPVFLKEETIVIGNKKSYSKIISGFKEKTKNLSGTYALYVIDLSNSYSFGIDENKIMQAASLIKLPIMLYAQEQASGSEGLRPGGADDSKIEAMGKRSDNAVFNEMRKQFGDKTLQDFIGSIGMANTTLIGNKTTPTEVGEFFQKYKDEPFMQYLADTIFEDWLTRGVPEGTKVVHKYGREVHVVNDAGIVYPVSGNSGPKPYIVVIMTQGVVEKEADEVFPELSRLVYDGMTE